MALRICGGRTGMSHENLPSQFGSAGLEKTGSTTAQHPSNGPARTSRSALGDISAIVSNVSATTGSFAKALAGANCTTWQSRTGGAKAGLAGTAQNPGSTNITTTTDKVAHQPGQAAAMDVDEYSGHAAGMDEGVMDVDRADAEDPQCVAEYLGDIFQNLRQGESMYAPRSDYMAQQADLNEKMRGILVDWLVEVHLKYKLKQETLYLAVNLIDRFLGKRQVSRRNLQLVGVCGMLIAAKYEEIYPPEVKDFVYITDKAYTRDQILQMEITMLNVLEFQLTMPSPIAFLERFAKVNECDEAHANLARYLMELTLCDIKMLRYCPSHLAASAVLLSNKILRRHPSWPAHLIKHTRYTESLIKSCAKEICCLAESADRSSLQGVQKKYSQQRFNAVSKMVSSA